MSYDLIFCREKGRPLAFEDVAAWAARRKYFERSAPKQLWYENKDTGVYFSFEYENFDPEDGLVPPQFEDIRLSFNLNFFRPSFFAYEAMPIVTELARNFGLLGIEDSSPPAACDAEQLTASWIESNSRAAKAVIHAGEVEEPFYMPAEKSLEWWRYMYRHEELSKELEMADVFVPTLFLLALNDSRNIRTAVTWIPDVHMIVPDCELVILGRKRKGFLAAKEERGIVSLRTISETLGNLIEDYDHARGLRIVKPENLGRVERALATIPFSHTLKEVSRISPDRIIDANLNSLVI
jgi:hypothetical protein